MARAAAPPTPSTPSLETEETEAEEAEDSSDNSDDAEESDEGKKSSAKSSSAVDDFPKIDDLETRARAAAIATRRENERRVLEQEEHHVARRLGRHARDFLRIVVLRMTRHPALHFIVISLNHCSMSAPALSIEERTRSVPTTDVADPAARRRNLSRSRSERRSALGPQGGRHRSASR